MKYLVFALFSIDYRIPIGLSKRLENDSVLFELCFTQWQLFQNLVYINTHTVLDITACVPGCLALTVITLCCSGPEWKLGTVCTLLSRDCRDRSAARIKMRGVEVTFTHVTVIQSIFFFFVLVLFWSIFF